MIRSHSLAIHRKGISQISRRIILKSRSVHRDHVARISSTCIKHSDASPSNAHVTRSKFTLDIKLPDLAASPVPPGPEIPFLPDFWDSSRTRGASSIRHDVDHEAPMRPILVVGGTSSLQAAGGPTYDGEHSSPTLEHTTARTQTQPTSSPPKGLWADFIDDFQVANPFQQSIISSQQPHSPNNRPLNNEEKRGLWALLSFIGGACVVGGLVSKSKSKPSSTHDSV